MKEMGCQGQQSVIQFNSHYIKIFDYRMLQLADQNQVFSN